MYRKRQDSNGYAPIKLLQNNRQGCNMAVILLYMTFFSNNIIMIIIAIRILRTILKMFVVMCKNVLTFHKHSLLS